MSASALDELDNGKNDSEDIGWLSSLSDSELVFHAKSRQILFSLLIFIGHSSLKQLVMQRAKVIGRSHIAARFDLKILRALGFVVMKHFKSRLKDSPAMLDLSEASVYVENTNLLKVDCKDGLESSIEDIMSSAKSISRKRKAEGQAN